MSSPLRILLLEDLASDAELIEVALRREALDFRMTRVLDRASFENELRSDGVDVILADYSLPGFSGMEALEIAQRERPEIPFLFVSGALGEDRAVETLKRGATDYVLKDRLSRLASAVTRSLEEAEERRGRAQAEERARESHEALRRSESTQRVLLEITNAAVTAADREELWQVSAEALRALVPFDRASMALLTEDRNVLRLSTVLAEDGEIQAAMPSGATFPLDHVNLDAVFMDQAPMVRGDLEVDAVSEVERQLRRAGIRSYVSVPMVGSRGVLGAVNVGSATPERYGAFHVSVLRSAADQIGIAVERLLAFEEVDRLRHRLELENVHLRKELLDAGAFGEIIGASPAIREIQEQIEQVAPTHAAVLIMGESGTGKELVAREVHARSRRRGGPLIKVNCAAVPRELYESEFFGHAQGAFSGAIRDREGKFAAADGGTLFLDEVGEIPLELQSKLLRVLQDGSYQRVGEERTRKVDVRIVAATNRDLPVEVKEGRFREDLFYRINVFPIQVPPLRARKEDIPVLASRFLEQAGRELRPEALKGEEPRLTQAHMEALMAYDWPGNVRELRNVVERAVITARSGRLRFALPGGTGEPGGLGGLGGLGRTSDAGRSSGTVAPGTDGGRRVLPESEMRRLMRENILAALASTGGKVYGPEGAAALLEIPPTTLASRMKSLGIEG